MERGDPYLCTARRVIAFDIAGFGLTSALPSETLPTIAKKAPALALFTSVFIHAYSKKLDGLYIYPNGMQDMSKATLA